MNRPPHAERAPDNMRALDHSALSACSVPRASEPTSPRQRRGLRLFGKPAVMW